MIIKCNNKNACGSKITVRAGDRKQEIYNWWPNLDATQDAISRWCHLWQMKLHPLKCEVLCISNKRSPPKFDYKIKVLLKWRSSVKYLGVHINSKLSWNDHCSANTAKATRPWSCTSSGTISGCSVSMKFRAFMALVLPILEYAAQLWNPHTKKNIDKLELSHTALWYSLGMWLAVQ